MGTGPAARRTRAARVRRVVGAGALVAAVLTLLGAGVVSAAADDGGPTPTSTTAPPPSSTTTTATAPLIDVDPTTTTTTTTVAAPSGAPAAQVPPPTVPAVPLAAERPRHDDGHHHGHDGEGDDHGHDGDDDEGGCWWDGESPLPSATALTAPATVPTGDGVPLAVTVTNDSCVEHAAPTGDVRVWRLAPGDAEATTLAVLPLADGAAAFTDTGATTVGTYTYGADYEGQESGWPGEDGPWDPGFFGSSSPETDVEVVPVPTTLSLEASTDLLYDGNDLALTVLVRRAPEGGDPVPRGTVTVLEGEYPVGTVDLVDGAGVLTLRPSVGFHEYTARYDGYADAAVSFAPAGPAEAWTYVAPLPVPRVELTSDPPAGSVVPAGTPVTFTATVLPPDAGEEGAPLFAGTVVYAEDGAPVGSRPVGESFTVVPGPGSHSYTAAYQGAPGAWAVSEASNAITLTVQEVATTTTSSTTTSTTAPPPPTSTPTTAPVDPPTTVPAPPGSSGAGVGGAVAALVGGEAAGAVEGASPVTTTTTTPPTTTTTPPPTTPPDDGDAATPTEVAGVRVDTDAPVERSPLVAAVPEPADVDLSPAHLAGNLVLTLLLILAIALPAELFNSTLKEQYHRVNRPLGGVQAWLAAVEARLLALPNPVLLVGFAVVGALIASELDPHVGLNATSLVMFAALALAFVVITLVLELARIPYLDRRAGRRRRHHLRLYPLVLILGAVFVAVSRLAEFRPGYIFGITCGLLLADDVGEEDDARSLVMAAVLLLATSVGAWLLWLPFVGPVQGASPSLVVLFGDAFLATLWISCLQVVVFGYAPLEALYGKVVQRWRPGVWAAIYGTAMFLLVTFLLHPSAGRWGGLTTTTFLQMLSLFLVFLVASVALWAWFRFRPDPTGGPGEAAEPTTVGAGRD